MAWQNIFKDCYTGTDFENRVAEFLKALSFEVRRLGKSDGGVDIIATTTTKPTVYSFNIQCKYFNRPVDKRPIQEVYTGTNYYGNDAQPVVITNNHVTAEARIYAKRVGVEIIADAEWHEIEQVYKAKKIINPNPHKGLLGIILAYIAQDRNYLQVATAKTPKPPSDIDQLRLEIANDLDAAAEYLKEAAHLEQKATWYKEKVIELQKKAILANLDYG